MNAAARIGLDIGGTKVEAVALGAAGDIEAHVRTETVPGAEGVLSVAERSIRELIATTGRSMQDFAPVGIGVPGQVDRAAGTVQNAFNLGVRAPLDLAPRLARRLAHPVVIDNDVTAAAVGATRALGLTGTVAYLNLGTGLAAGIVVGGKPLRGVHGFAGEVGHLPIDPLGRVCPCGQRGCLETVASGAALKAHWNTPGDRSGVSLLAAVDAGSPDAREALSHLVRGAASAIRVLSVAVDPDAIVIGGGLRLLGEPLLRPIGEQLDAWAAESHFLSRLEMSARVRTLPEHDPAAAIGAAYSAETLGRHGHT